MRTGGIASSRAHGMPWFEYLGGHPGDRRPLQPGDDGRDGAVGRRDPAYDFAGVGRLVDVGGGHGLLLATILRAHPAMRGVLFDLPAVVAGAAPVLAEAGVTDRCEGVGGDFFATVPPDGDAYLLRHIVHDWDDAQAVAILANCRRALPDAGKVLVIEQVIAPDYRRSLPTLELDLQMLVMLGGQERTEAEYRALFAAAGLRLSAVVPLGDAGQFSVIEGVPA
ncbi:MAG: methyltransferase [Chloroflexia bacterium]